MTDRTPGAGTLFGDGTISPEAEAQMQEYCDEHEDVRWAAYQNHELGHPHLGSLRFLAIGPNQTFGVPPVRYPDTQYGIGWRYLFVGWVDLEKHVVIEEEPCHTQQ